MRTSITSAALLVAALGLFSACNKHSSDPDKQPPIDVEGVQVDAPTLMAEFLNAPPELQEPVNKAVTEIRYKGYIRAVELLEGVSSNPKVNDKQKKLINRVIDQLKQVVAKTPA